VGFGSIGAGVVPLLLRHVVVAAERVTLLTAPDRGDEAHAAARRHGFACVVVALTPANFRQARPSRRPARPAAGSQTLRTSAWRARPLTLALSAPLRQVLAPLVAADDVVLNLSVDVSSVALIALCAERGAIYIDTVRLL